MSLSLSVEQFKTTFAVKEGKLTHHSGKKFKLFPFIANTSSEPITDFNKIVGGYINRIERKVPEIVTMEEFIGTLKNETNIEPGREDLFEEVIRHMFFDANGRLLPINIHTLAQNPCELSSECRVADYLVDVLGDADVLKRSLDNASRKLDQQSNVLERFAVSKLKTKPMNNNADTTYHRIVEVFKDVYEEDFDYVLQSRNRTSEYLVTLLEFYYFMYTAQTCLQLNRFMDGKRNQTIPLYFCLDWEKTSQSRRCFSEGWATLLQPAIKRAFTHAIVLEILNQTEGNSSIDYIALSNIVENSVEIDLKVASEISKLTDAYRSSILDCPEMLEMKRKDIQEDFTAVEIKYLFDSVNCQFENTVRSRAYAAYYEKFEAFAYKFLKRRGRSGMMLNVTEELLIFLTKICIKDEDKMRLNDVFKEFEQRGIFLDELSKEQVMKYYEKLNLIEKKSDSGDAQYVKRIL